ncbi:cupin domain-containing protein [Bradyrhizobium sp. OAE829]|uniref:(R)-mandelonitrile lyase n=1 Tax=Bradyrhizobium sp. OAE829 TaxID=2663807 RepID=UPI00178ADE4B
MKITRCDNIPANRASEKTFTGIVHSEPINTAPDPARVAAARVSFLPGARTAWHHHPYGQTLYVTSGTGLVQIHGEPANLIRAGDSVWIAPGETHWHGATARTSMTHIAIHERSDGSYASWLEHVTDDQYAAAQLNAE